MVAHGKMIKGLAVSSGIAKGPAFVITREAPFAFPKRFIKEGEVVSELKRFDLAIREAEIEISDLQKNVREKIGSQAAEIFNTQLLVLRDPYLSQEITQKLSSLLINLEWALSDLIEQVSQVFIKIEDPFFQERAADIRDVARRVLSILGQRKRVKNITIPEGAIVVADELSSSMTAHLQLQSVCGFVTERGSKTSHATILAHTLGIPAVTGISEATSTIQPGDPLIVDGVAGLVFLHPQKSVLREYERLERDFKAYRESLKELVDLPVETRDGVKVKLYANIGKLADAEAALLFGADGVGLYRTEFSFLIRHQCPNEEEQYQILKAVAGRFHPRPVVIRLLDLGADKILPYLPLPPAINPSLAERGIRLLLKHRDILKTQMRAILRVSADHPVSILLPMVGGVEEVIQAKKALKEAQDSLNAEEITFNPQIPFGAMIETPAAAVMVGRIAKEVDFFSLGTNDLVQYVLAVDRNDPSMASYYEPLHPAIIRTLLSVVDNVASKGRELSLCGEMAGNPFYTPLLLGMGLRSFSVAPGEILEIKKAIRSASIEKTERLFEKILDLSTAKEIEQCLKKGQRYDSAGRTGY